MEKLMVDLFTYLITNADKITAAIGIIIVVVILANLVDKITKRADAQSTRDDALNNRLLDLHGKTVILLEIHEKAAQERAAAQEIRDKERIEISRSQTEALSKISDYLSVVGDTKKTVDTIHAVAVHTQGSVSDLGTDMTGLITRRSEDVNQHVDNLKKALEQSLDLIENAIKKMQPRLDGIAEIQESHVEAQSARHGELVTEIRSVGSAISTITVVMDNAYHLLEQLQTQILPSTQPIPELLWTTEIEEAEPTAIIPPRKLADDDGNPLLDKSA